MVFSEYISNQRYLDEATVRLPWDRSCSVTRNNIVRSESRISHVRMSELISQSNMDILENAKKAAAYKVVDEYVQDKSVVGIGSGSTIVYVVQRLAERVKNENLSVVCIAMSFPVKQMISDHGLVLAELENHPKLDLTIDGANEVDEDLNLIKGGGGYLLQEKVIASCSEEFVIVADHTKITKKFGGPCKIKIPIEVVPLANVPTRKKIQSKFGGTVKLRIAPKTAKYGPVVTDNGNFLLDWDFPSDIHDWEKTNAEISLIPGVVETGIFINLATKAYFGMEDGSVREQVRITRRN